MKNKSETLYFDKKGKKLAIKDNVYASEMINESYWYSDSNDSIQVAKIDYDKGKIFRNHKHSSYDRNLTITQECLLVITGGVRVNVYDEKRKFIDTVSLRTGDFLILLGGYHELEITQDATRLMEFKNGPFASVEKDKTYYD